jgi:formyl-CoA transferase
LSDLIEKELLKDTGDSWVERFNAVGVPCGPVNTVAETFADPQVQHLGMATPVTHQSAGDIEIIRNATNMEGVSSEIRMPSPLKGQHSKEVLLEFGFTQEEIEELSLSGAVEVNPD